MSVIQSVENFFSTELKKFVAWIEGKENALKPILKIAETVLNGLKSFDGSVVGQTIETAIESWIPASKALVDAFQLQLPVWLIKLKWIEDESTKTLAEQWADAKAYIDSIDDPDVKAAQLNTLKALFTKFFASDGFAAVTIQQTLALAQPTHSDITAEPGTN